MSATLRQPRYEEPVAVSPVRIVLDPQHNGDERHESPEDEMTKTEAQLFEIREIVHTVAGSVAVSTKLLERLLENQTTLSQTQSQSPANGREVGRSVDTLRRDIGMLAILLG